MIAQNGTRCDVAYLGKREHEQVRCELNHIDFRFCFVHLQGTNRQLSGKECELSTLHLVFSGSQDSEEIHVRRRGLISRVVGTGAPQSTKVFALVVDDPDAPVGTWNHWLLWNIPPSTHHLDEGVAKDSQLTDGARQGRNDFGKIGYNGPCPPPGQPHRYLFRLFALDSQLALAARATRAELDRAMKSHGIAQTELMGRYGR